VAFILVLLVFVAVPLLAVCEMSDRNERRDRSP
jgi:hypothetical protein